MLEQGTPRFCDEDGTFTLGQHAGEPRAVLSEAGSLWRGGAGGKKVVANPTSFSLDATSRTPPLGLAFLVLPKNPPGSQGD